MTSFLKLAAVELKLFFRVPIMAFFTLFFPFLLLLLFGAIFGNAPNPMFGGLGTVDVMVPSYAAMIVAMSALLTLPITLSDYRGRGVLRRMRATPVRPAAVLGAQLVVVFTMTLAGMGVLIVVGRLVFGLRFGGNPLAVLAAFTLSSLSFFAFGMILAGVMPNVQSASAVGNILLYPMIYLSGATIPIELLPQSLRNVSRFIPLTYSASLMRGLWLGDSWSRHGLDCAVLGGFLVVSGVVAVATFRWE